MSEFIDIVFDGPPGPVAGRFVEVEGSDGASLSVGAWIDRGNGLWALRIERQLAEPKGCPVHDGAMHGGEAEELRKGVEDIIHAGNWDQRTARSQLIALLDRVNARDAREAGPAGADRRCILTAAKLDPDLCRAMAAAILTGGLSVGRSLLAEQLNAAVHLADEFASATAARDAQFVALRKALHVRLSEVQLLHAVVVAADAWRDDPCKGLGSHKEADLAAAVDYYRAQQRITPALERAAVAITGQPAAALTEQIKPATASIGPADTAVIVEALDLWDRYLTAPHADIARIRAALTGTVLS